MPWLNDIDPTRPSDIDPAAEGDNQIRELKAALEERLDSRMPGWPDSDPLRLLAADVGPFADRPAAEPGSGQLYISVDDDVQRLFFTLNGVWLEFAAGQAGAPSAVAAPTGMAVSEDSTCVGDVPTYLQTITWTDAVVEATTKVYVDGVEVDDVAYDVETKGLTLGPGTYLIGLRHVKNGILSDIVTKSITVVNPCVPATAVPALKSFTVADNSFCDAGPTSVYRVELRFTRNTSGAQVRIKMDGVQILLLAGSTPSSLPVYYTISGGTAKTYTFEATQVVGGVDGPPITRQITLPDPCATPALAAPTGLDIVEDGQCVGTTSNNEALISWTNTEATAKVRIYRELLGGGVDSPLVELAAGTTSFVDTTVVTGETYHYWLTHFDPAGPTESATTGSLHYVASDICEGLPEE